MEGFAAPATIAPAAMPDDIALAEVASRPTRVAGGQPVAGVLLVEFEKLETAG